MQSSGSITTRRACFISMPTTSSAPWYTRTIRRAIYTTRRIRSAAATRPRTRHFFHAVVEAIGGAGAVLIGGPANAKHELFKHIQRHAPQLLPRIAAVETLDHPSDGELVAHARKYFRAEDRMAPQRS